MKQKSLQNLRVDKDRQQNIEEKMDKEPINSASGIELCSWIFYWNIKEEEKDR